MISLKACTAAIFNYFKNKIHGFESVWILSKKVYIEVQIDTFVHLNLLIRGADGSAMSFNVTKPRTINSQS